MIEMLLVLKEANENGNKKNVFHAYREETKSRKYRTIKRKFTTGEARTYVWPHGGTTGKSKTQVHLDLQVRQSIPCKQAKVHFAKTGHHFGPSMAENVSFLVQLLPFRTNSMAILQHGNSFGTEPRIYGTNSRAVLRGWYR